MLLLHALTELSHKGKMLFSDLWGFTLQRVNGKSHQRKGESGNMQVFGEGAAVAIWAPAAVVVPLQPLLLGDWGCGGRPACHGSSAAGVLPPEEAAAAERWPGGHCGIPAGAKQSVVLPAQCA